MTAPPGGPYGQDPSANPYWQNPYWGGQPQGEPYQGGQPQGEPYQGGQPQGDQYQGGQPQGDPYQNPQGGPHQQPPHGDPYAFGSAPTHQAPLPGQQYPPGSYPPGPYPPGPYPPGPYPPGQYPPGPYPPGQYPPGPPPGGPRSKKSWLIGGGIALLAVIALVVALVLIVGHHNNSNQAEPSTAGSAPSSASPGAPQPGGSQQNATDCTPNVSGGDAPSGDTVSAGALSFPTSAAPGWMPISDSSTPNAIGAVGVAQEVPNANQWMMQAELAVTNFVTSMSVDDQASKLMNCFVTGPGYSQSGPSLGPIKTSTTTVDGTEAARADADITISDSTRHVPGDSVTIIAVKTKPVTIFFGASPIGDAGSRATIDAVIAALEVKQS
jgi:hypothetical protein